MADIARSINAMSQFLSGYLGEKERMEEKEKKEKQRKKIEQMVNSGEYKIKMNTDGSIGVESYSPQKEYEEKLKQQKTVQLEQENLLRQRIKEKIDRGENLTPQEDRFYYGYQPNVWGFMGGLPGGITGGVPATPKATPKAAPAAKRINVKRKSDGQPGTILETDWNPDIYEKR